MIEQTKSKQVPVSRHDAHLSSASKEMYISMSQEQRDEFDEDFGVVLELRALFAARNYSYARIGYLGIMTALDSIDSFAAGRNVTAAVKMAGVMSNAARSKLNALSVKLLTDIFTGGCSRSGSSQEQPVEPNDSGDECAAKVPVVH